MRESNPGYRFAHPGYTCLTPRRIFYKVGNSKHSEEPPWPSRER